MSAKVSFSFGDTEYNIPPDKALDFFQGCIDAFLDMGLFRYPSIVDLVEVVRIYPNIGIMAKGEIVIEVVVGWQEHKKKESCIVRLTNEDIRATVRTEVKKITEALARQIKGQIASQEFEINRRLEIQS